MQNTFDNWQNTGNELAHYGVLGMKWGYRKDPQKAFAKAAAKKNRLERRAAKGNVKSASIQKKVAKAKLQEDKLSNRLKKANDKGDLEKATKLQGKKEKLNTKINKLTMKRSKADLRDAKTNLKATKWTQSMLKVFGATSYAELEKKYA